MSKLTLLKTESDFGQFRTGKSYQTRLIRIRIAGRPARRSPGEGGRDQNIPRFGFIIPKKVLPRAVDRNLVRRRIKIILTRNLEKLKPADVLIFPNSLLLKKKFADLEQEFTELFSKANLWKS